jgi:hypothetical protein
LLLELLWTECPPVSVHQLVWMLLPCGYVMGVHGGLVAGTQVSKERPHGTPGQAGAPITFFAMPTMYAPSLD